MNATFVVVGGGIAGVSCVEQLSLLCPEESIILVSATSVVKMVTNLCQMSQLLSTFDVQETDKSALENQFKQLKVVQGAVLEVDAERHELLLGSGVKIGYQFVILCHGARPKLCANDKFILGIRDTESVARFQDHLKGAKRIVIVGNGGIATEMVHELKNVEVVWVIKDASISATFVDPGAGQFFIDQLFNRQVDEEKVTKRSKFTAQELLSGSSSNQVFGGALGPDWHSGMRVEGSLKAGKKVTVESETEVTDIKELDNEEFKVAVSLANGKEIKCDFVVSATGVIPNGDSIRVEGLALDSHGAIVVNQQMATNLNHVYAAGDVCSCAHWAHSKLWLQMRLWTQARQMGHFAGQCVHAAWLDDDGASKELDFCFEMFTHATRFFGFKVVLLGLFNAQNLQDYEILLRVTKGQEYVKVVLKEGRMQGAILIGETDLEETFENLILNQMDLSSYGADLLDPSIDIEDYFD